MADILEQVADFLEKGEYRKKVRVGITTLGSEHGTEEIIRGAELAQKLYDDVEVVLIGQRVTVLCIAMKPRRWKGATASWKSFWTSMKLMLV